ncbi:hypothetical protein LuPra_00892 [Luteitalea pratensis]|uniref:Uncharacterized protein n=1 Tax=Luteitalea pratensis TaxID=1855912 RepID=A0A143PGJ7_LUTPR|nr:DUF4062 domain-containing protein [Luteitalea pratensis]AMY07712.1 hypothetical protein LuPra_00892 [Luteitalea pratensis]
MEPLKVFVSSTWIDLIVERDAIERAARRLESIRFVGMEYFGARTATTRQASLDEVDRSHIYVGVIGHRWGSGITAEEYRRAIARGLPCLIYLKANPPAHDPQPRHEAERRAAWLRELQAAHTVVQFETAAELATRIVADLHNLIFDRLVAHGARQLHGDFDGRIQRFLEEYLGRPDAPVPFGGRNAELAQLDRWLADPRAAPYALVAGPAGRGKSALLVHWARQLTRHADLALVYFPISIRFRTNLANVAFTSIAARLATVHGEPLLAGPETPAEVWRELTAAYLRRPPPAGRRLLVILDGADESADWELGPDLFPAVPTERLRIVVSARYLAGDVDARGWIARLGWSGLRLAHPFDLPPLSARGLTDVLQKSSVPLEVLSQRADVVAELFRLTEGDPLLVNLYVSDLWARGEEVARLRPEDLGALEPGLEGYFHRWWDDQRALWGDDSPFKEPAVDGVFNALACALGPLLTAELLELLPGPRSMAVWTLDDVMSDLKRFVVGDGDTQGYALSHPRLAEYFYDRLANAGQQHDQELRYVRWCRAWLTRVADGSRPVSEVPAYLLYFTRPHFDRAACTVDDYLGMASNAWVRAWDRIDKGSYGGFLGDLRRACEIAARDDDAASGRGEPVRYLATELRGPLCTSSIASQAADMPAALLCALLECGVWTSEQAIAYATRIPDQEDRFHSVLALAAVTADADRPLALAAGLGELRALLRNEEGITILRGVLRTIANAKNLHTGPAMAGRFLEAVWRIAQHGLNGEQLDIVRAAVTEAAARCTVSPEQRAIVRAAAAAASPDTAPADVSGYADLRDAVATGSRSTAAERLSMLQRAIGDGTRSDTNGLREAALYAAAQVLGSAIVAGSDLGPDGFTLLCRAWQALPRTRADASRAELVPYLAAPQLELLTMAARRLPPPERLHELRAILHDASPSAKRLVAAAMHAEELLADPGDDRWRSDLEWASATSEHEARIWFEKQAARLRFLRDECLALCAALVRSRPEPALQSFVAERALAVIAEKSVGESASAAMAALVDLLQPEGSGDSFEEWRPAAIDGGSSTSQIRLMLIAAKVDRASLWSTARRLAERFAQSPRHRQPGWTHRIAIVGQLMALDLGAEATGATSADRPEAIARSALAATAPPSLSASLRVLVDGIDGVEPSILRDAVPLVLAAEDRWGEAGSPYVRLRSSELVDALTLLPCSKLWPPHADTAAAIPQLARVLWGHGDVDQSTREQLLDSASMPDISREGIFAAALRAPLQDLEIPLRVARLARPSDELMTMALAAVCDAKDIRPTLRVDCLVALLPVVREQTLVRWLEAASTLNAIEQGTFRLMAFGPDASAHFGPVLDAVARLGSAQQRERWLSELTAWYRTWRIDDAIALAGKLPDPGARLDRWFALIGQLPPDGRLGLLGHALRLSAEIDAPAMGRRLVQMAVDLMPTSQSVLGDATAAAIAIRDRNLRSDALAALARVLPTEQTTTAVAAARRIDDVAPRMRAVRALAEFCPSGAAHAVNHLLAAGRSLPTSSVQAAASIYVSPLLAPPDRWIVLARAFDSPIDGRTGFEWPELFESLAVAMVDAPARVMASALKWLGIRPPSADRTRALLRLSPALPRHLQLPAAVLIAADVDRDALASASLPWSPPELNAARELARLPAETRKWLDDIAAQQRRAREAFLDAGGLDASMAAQVERVLQSADNDVARHASVCRLALERDLSPAAVRLLAETAGQIGDAVLRRSAIRSLAVFAPAGSLVRAVAAVAAVEAAADRGRLQIRLAERQSGRSRDKTFELALASIAAEPDPLRRVAAAVACGVAAPSYLLDVLNIVGQAAEVDLRFQALRELIPRLPDTAAAAVVARVTGMLPTEYCVRVLCDVAADERAAIGAPVLNVADGLLSAASRGRLLAAWAPFLNDGLQSHAVGLLEGITTDFAWLEALSALVARWPALLTPVRAERAAEMLIEIAEDEVTFAWLRTAAAAWPASAIRSYVDAIRTLRHDSLRCEAIGWATSSRARLPLQELVALARAITDPSCRSIALGQAAVASVPVDELLLQEALRDARRTGHHALRVGATVSMVEYAASVPAPLVDTLVEESVQQPIHAMQAFRKLAHKLDANQAIALLRALPPNGNRAECAERVLLVESLAPQLLPRHLAALLDDLPGSTRPRQITELLTSIAPFIVDEESRSSALAVALGLGRGTWGAHALLAIADRLDPPREREVLAALLETPLETERWRRLTLVRSKLDAAVLEAWQRAADSIRADIRNGWPDAAQGISAKDDRTAPGLSRDPAIADRLIESLLDELKPAVRAAYSSDKRPPIRVTQAGSTVGELWRRLDRLDSEHDRFDEIVRQSQALNSSDCAALLARLADYLTPERHDLVVPVLVAGLRDRDRQELARLLERIDTPVRVGALLRRCHSHLGADMRPHLLPVFRTALHAHARSHRADALVIVEAWAPAVTLLGGDAAAVDVIGAITDVAEQWP